MTNQETDTALILENELKRRVHAVVHEVVHREVKARMDELFVQQKADMLLEISLAVGKMLRMIEKEGRTPLWETNMEVPTFHNIEKVDRNAIREQTPPV